MNPQNRPHTWSTPQKWATLIASLFLVGGAAYFLAPWTGSVPPDPAPDAATPARSEVQNSTPPRAPSPGGQARPAGASPASPASGKAQTVLVAKAPPQGSPLPVPGMNPDTDKGRVVKLEPVALKHWGELKQGTLILLPTATGETLEGVVNLVMEDNGWVRMGGALSDEKGSFTLNTNADQVNGQILLPSKGIGYEIVMDGTEVLLIERRLSSLICWPGIKPSPNQGHAAAAMPNANSSSNTPQSSAAASGTVPIINTNPGAKGVVFCNFTTGETITDPDWNNGTTFNIQPSGLSASQITQVLAMAAEDYAPFNLTFTTDSALYEKTSYTSRMKVIFTPTKTAAPGAGGVAGVGSWAYSSSSIRKCWVFNEGTKSAAEALSHELGHTLGLSHDGQLAGGTNSTSFMNDSYYNGHGGGLTIPTSWCPIMGAGYTVNLTQFSKGEYFLANNTEDDLAIIAANNFGYGAATPANGAVNILPISSTGTFSVTGLLPTAQSSNLYEFTTSGGQITATVRPAVTETTYSNLDTRLDLVNVNSPSTIIQTANDLNSLNSTLTWNISTPGTYRLKVSPTGTGDRPPAGYTTGYSAYGSVGNYALTGSVAGAVLAPVFFTPRDIYAQQGVPLSVKINTSIGTNVSLRNGSTLPNGLYFTPATSTLNGTPVSPSDGILALRGTNILGTADADFNIHVASAGSLITAFDPSLRNGFGSPTMLGRIGNISTSATAPWKGVDSTPLAAGSVGIAAMSGAILNNGTSSIKFTYQCRPNEGAGDMAPWNQLTFYWKTSTEAGHDLLKCKIDGVVARDADTAKELVVSGETSWTAHTVRFTGTGLRTFEFVYTKDASLSVGQDRVWVYVTAIGQPPVITKAPSPVRLAAGGNLALESDASGVDALLSGTLTWMKAEVGSNGTWPGGVPLQNGTLSTGTSASVVSGADTGSLRITNVTGRASGMYWLRASNAVATVESKHVEVVVPAPPVFTTQPIAPSGLKVGGKLVLTANVSGATPMYYQWKKDGAVGPWLANPTLEVNATASSAGKYKLTAMNLFGTVSSAEITVLVSPK